MGLVEAGCGVSDSQLKPSLLISHTPSSEGLSMGTKLAKCTPFLERTLPPCLFILESSGKDLCMGNCQ